MFMDFITKIIVPPLSGAALFFVVLAAGHITRLLPLISFVTLSSNGRNTPITVKIRKSLSYEVMAAVLAQELYESRLRGLNPYWFILSLLMPKTARRRMNIISHTVETLAWAELTKATLAELDAYRLKEATTLKSSSSYAGSFDDMTIAEIEAAMIKSEKKARAYWNKNKAFILKTLN